MRAAAVLLILCVKASSAFHLQHAARSQSSPTVRKILGQNVVGNDADGLTSNQRERAANTDNSSAIVASRQTFLAKALLASALAPFSIVSHAYADEIAGENIC